MVEKEGTGPYVENNQGPGGKDFFECCGISNAGGNARRQPQF